MGKTLYILFVCGAGLGSSFAAQMAAEAAAILMQNWIM